MKASQQHQLRLLELANLDAARARLQHTAKNIPEQLNLEKIEGDRRARRAATAQALGELEDAQAQLHRVESDVQTVVQRQHADEEKLEKSTSTKEVTAYETELASLRRRRDRLETEQFELEQEVERLQGIYDEARETMRELETLATDLLERRDLARENLKAEAQELATARRTLVDGMPRDLFELYEGIRGKLGIGAAELVGNVSMASNETLEVVDLANVRRAAADEVLFCPMTGAILVRTERSDV
jgi:predicted  nucleic acid-binding Zn-ribbon protein